MSTASILRTVRQAPFHDAGHGYDVFGLHPPTLARAVALSAPIYDRYFRVDSRGIEQVPANGAAILVANHGGALPVDAAMLCLDVVRRTAPMRIPRPVTDHFVPRLPFVSTLLARLGAVTGTRTNVRTLIERGELIVIWPEGVSGPAKPFRDRYKLQRWTSGFADLAIQYGVPVIPVAIVGAEESWPVIARLRRPRLFGAPYVPITAVPVPLPSHYHLHYGAPLVLEQGRARAGDPAIVARAAATVRVALEGLLDETLRSRTGVFE